MKNIIKFTIILLLILNVFTVGILTVGAEGLLPKDRGNCPSGVENCGNYQLNDMASIAITVSQFILGIVGSLSLLAFVAGGLMMMLSAGNPEWVTRGKQTLIGAVIGLVIVFASYTIIYFVYRSMGINFTGTSIFPAPITGTK